MPSRQPPLIPILTAVLVAIATTFAVIALSGPRGVPRVEGPVIDWAAKAQAGLAAAGHTWAKAKFDSGALIVLGTAPNAEDAASAFAAARATIAADPAATGVVLGYSNQIVVRQP